MIYLFHGTDSARVRTKAFAWIAAARAKQPDASYVRLGLEDISEKSLEEITQSQGLFYSKMLVLLDDPFALSESAETVLAMLEQLAETKNPIAILAPKLTAPRLKKIEPLAHKLFVVDDAKKKAPRGFNSSLVNALGARDGKTLWKELMKAHKEGDVPEMLHGLLHWKARDMMSKGSRMWKPEEARKLSVELIELVSSSRSGDLPLGMALEKFALSLS